MQNKQLIFDGKFKSAFVLLLYTFNHINPCKIDY